ncbi:MAG: PDZ domain-containing protein [Armatimonadetes bacterium]|nr:PDZ domain-containing protein [Armatimonadota bacterium]
MLATLTAALILQTPNYAATWQEVSGAISSRYYARAERRTEMNALLTKYGPIASAAKSNEEFAATMRSMIAEFGDSHFDFVTAEDQGFAMMANIVNTRGMGRGTTPQLPNIGAWFKRDTGGFRVMMVLNDSPAAAAGLEKGDLVTTIEGNPFTPVKSLQPFVGKSVKLTFVRGTETKSVQVTPIEQLPYQMFYTATQKSTKIIERNGKKIAVFRPWTMVDIQISDMLGIFVRQGLAGRSDALIYDLRDGFGGRPEGFFELFFAPDYELAWGLGSVTSKQRTGYDKPMVVLTNEGTRSAKEVVSAIFKKSKRATLIGQPTKGDVLGTFPQMIGDWGILEIPMVDLAFEGERMEKNPVQPDISVKDDPFRPGDEQFEAALDHLSK